MNRSTNMGRRSLTLVALVFVVLLFVRWTPAQQDTTGGTLYRTHCVRCHGELGDKRKWGAADLRKSVLSDALILRQVAQGKGIMPSFAQKLSVPEREALMHYVKSLRYNTNDADRYGAREVK